MESPPVNSHIAPCKTLFLAGSLRDVSLLAYDQNINKFIFFEHFIAHGLGNNCTVLYAYYSKNLIATFKNEIRNKQIIPYELRNGLDGLKIALTDLCCSSVNPDARIRIIFDFSRDNDSKMILELLSAAKNRMAAPSRITGIVAFNMEVLDDGHLQELSKEFSSFLFLTGDTNLISFPVACERQPDASIIPSEIVDSVVRHSLEQLILMNLDQDTTGFDIIKMISERFHVDIPLARVYSYLYSLEGTGVVTTQIRGRAKIYSLTDRGRKYVEQRLRDFESAHEYILGYRR
jgi:predicted transcriptional regulator